MRLNYSGETYQFDFPEHPGNLDYYKASELCEEQEINEIVKSCPSCIPGSETENNNSLTEEFAENENIVFLRISDKKGTDLGYSRGVSMPFNGEEQFYGLEFYRHRSDFWKDSNEAMRKDLEMAGILPHVKVAEIKDFDSLKIGFNVRGIIRELHMDRPFWLDETLEEPDFKDDRPYDKGENWRVRQELGEVNVSILE